MIILFLIRLLHWTPTPVNYHREGKNVNNKIIISWTAAGCGAAWLAPVRLSESEVDEALTGKVIYMLY